MTPAPRRAARSAATPSTLLEGRDDLRRDRRSVPVELEQELLDHLRRVAAGGVLDVEGLTIDDGAVAHAEHLHVGARLALVQPEHIEGLTTFDARHLPLVHVPYGGEPVAQHPRAFELLRRGGGGHLAGDALLDGAEAAAKKVDGLLHDLHVLLVRDARVAGRQRALDEVLQARRAAGSSRLDAPALAIREDAPDHVERIADFAGARVRPEVKVAGHVPSAEEAHPRPLVAEVISMKG